jgi:hypothetical protein
MQLRRLDGPFGPWATALWEAAGLGVGVQRDEPYLNWRYAKPGSEYARFEIERGRGLLVLKVYATETSRTVHILDLIVRADERALVAEMLRFCFEFAAAHRAQAVTAWLPAGHAYERYFEAVGLSVTNHAKRFVFVHAPRPHAARLASSSAWHLTQGDSDVY